MSVKSVYPAALAASIPSVNEETLAGNKTIVEGDHEIQILDPNGTNRDVTLPATPTEGTIFYIINAQIQVSSGSATYLDVYIGTDTAEMVRIHAGVEYTFSYSSNGWIAYGNGGSTKRTTANVFEGTNKIAMGYGSRVAGAGSFSFAAGYNCNASGPNSTALGGSATSSGASSVAIGLSAVADTIAGAAIMQGANTGANYQVCLGYNTVGSAREGALVGPMFAGSTKARGEELGWTGDTTTATQTEIYLGSTGTSRATVTANAIISFNIQVVAREDATGDCAAWEFKGAIKRDGSNNTALVGSVTKTVIAEDAGATAWDVTVDADDTNESLRIQVTGEASHTIKWAAKGSIVERI